MFIDRSANGKLGHLEGHEDDGFNIANVDFSGYMQSAVGASFDNIPSRVANRRFDGEDLIRVGAHGGGKVLKSKMPTVDEPVGVYADKEAGQILVVDLWSG